MLEFKNFSLAYENYEGRENTIFENINLSFEEGSVNVISGESGSGKSSFIKLINGIIPEINDAKISGQLLFKGRNLFDENISNRSQYISTVFQNPKNQFYCINSSDEMAFALENRNVERGEILSKIDYYTRIFGIDKLLDRDLFKLSGGEKQLVAITSVALMDNEIYIFDEPSASLDNISIERLKNIIEILKEKKKIIIIAEHRLYYLRDIMDKLFVIEDKKINSYEREEVNDEFIKNHKLRTINEIKKEDLNKEKYIKKSFFDKNFAQGKIMECRNFHCKYRGSEEVIFDFNLSFDRGIYFIIGPNGIGKTTIFNLISKLYTDYEGEILINDIEISDIKDEDLRDEVLFIESKPFILRENLNSNITLLEKNKVDEPYLEKITQFLELERIEKYSTKNLKDTLSKGEQQKVQLARMMIGRYSLILLDEVLSGLDQEMKKKVISKIKEKSKNKIIVIVSHDNEIQRGCNEIILIPDKNTLIKNKNIHKS